MTLEFDIRVGRENCVSAPTKVQQKSKRKPLSVFADRHMAHVPAAALNMDVEIYETL